MRPIMQIAALASVAALALTGCGNKPQTANTTPSKASTPAASTPGASTPAASGSTPAATTAAAAATGPFQACMVLDTGGVDDRSFNQSSWAGMQAATKANPKIKTSYIPSNSQNDYVPNLNAEVKKGCDTILAVGGLMAGAVKDTAAKNPKTHFGQIDAPSTGPNIYGLQYNTAQAAYLTGYLAAGMTKTGKVATFGGLNIPPVTIYMDGFWEGVQQYNKAKNKKVQVLGWDEGNQKGGTFAQSFTDQNKGKQISQAFAQQGADVVFPVAGGTGLGAGAAAQSSGGKLMVVWVDTDGCVSAAQYCKYILTSATKNLAGSVEQYVEAGAKGNLPTGNYIGDLKNDGVGMAPYHDFDSKVPAELKKEVDAIKADIISGKIKVTSPSQPKQ